MDCDEVVDSAEVLRRVDGGEVRPNEVCQEQGFTDSFFFSSRRRHTRFDCDWSSDVCSSDLYLCIRSIASCSSCFSLRKTSNASRSSQLSRSRATCRVPVNGRSRRVASAKTKEIGRAHV